MSYRIPLSLFLLFVLAAGVAAQSSAGKALAKHEIFAALEGAKGSDELIEKVNADLIREISQRGVDFVLSPEEEWSLQLKDASDKLIAAIRDAIDPKEREHRLNIQKQQRLYETFSVGYNANDLSSKQAALTAAREFVSLYAEDPNVKEIVVFMQRNLPRLQQSVSMLQQREAAMERARAEAATREVRQQQDSAERERRRQEALERNAQRADRARTTPTPRDPAAVEKEKEPVQATEINRRRPPVVRRPPQQ